MAAAIAAECVKLKPEIFKTIVTIANVIITEPEIERF